jgi:heme/copper-type cytochrome/quinol oxidase subunit 2
VKIIGSQWQWTYEVHNYPFWISSGYNWRIFWRCIEEGVKWKTTTLAFLELNTVNPLLANYKYGFLWYSVHKKISNIILVGLLRKHKVLYNSIGYLTYINYKITSVTLPVEELNPGHYRLLEVSKAVLLPVQEWVRLNITASDVIHSWAVPSFGIKIDGVPGRLNTGYVLILHEGLFYGQCSEFCGKDHYRMSIVVKGF